MQHKESDHKITIIGHDAYGYDKFVSCSCGYVSFIYKDMAMVRSAAFYHLSVHHVIPVKYVAPNAANL